MSDSAQNEACMDSNQRHRSDTDALVNTWATAAPLLVTIAHQSACRSWTKHSICGMTFQNTPALRTSVLQKRAEVVDYCAAGMHPQYL